MRSFVEVAMALHMAGLVSDPRETQLVQWLNRD